MKRREFITLLGGSAIAWSRIARAQQATVPIVGFLDSSAAIGAKLNGFYEGLKTEGFIRNRNVAIEYHSAEGDYGRLPGLAADLVNRKVTVIAAAGAAAALAAKSATATIPVVFALDSDPVELGLVTNLNHPAGTMTGVTDMAVQAEQKRLELLHDFMPTASALALLSNPANPAAAIQARNALAATAKIGLKVNVLRASTEDDFDKAFTAAVEARVAGLVIADDELFSSRSGELAALALRHAVPAIYQHREFAAAGGLISYGSSLGETYHQVGAYAGLILKGGDPADLPVYQPSHAEFIINVKTAKTLSVAVPQALIAAATEVIE